jgi:AcrR family transcriptional regulator
MRASRQDETNSQPARRNQRLAPDDRKRQIVEAAVLYFAEVGFDGGTRELARRLDITQPLIYRYFPSKEDLIQAVYQEVYLTRWRPEWQVALNDAALPIRGRLISFYTEFTEAVFTPEWIRIYLFAGLRGLEMNQWWITFVEHHVLRNMAEAVRLAFDLPSVEAAPVGPREIELYWLFHGGIFYYGQRRVVYGHHSEVTLAAFIETSVDALLNGLPETVLGLLPARAKTACRSTRSATG